MLSGRADLLPLHFGGVGGSGGLFAQVMREGGTGGLEDGADLAGDVGPCGDLLAVLQTSLD